MRSLRRLVLRRYGSITGRIISCCAVVGTRLFIIGRHMLLMLSGIWRLVCEKAARLTRHRKL